MRGRTLLALGVLVVGLLFMKPWASRRWPVSTRGASADRMAPAGRDWRYAKIPEATISPAYDLEAGRALEFALPTRFDMIKIVTTANLSPEARREAGSPIPPTLAWRYAVKFELLESDGRVQTGTDYSLRTRLTEYRDPATATLIRSSFYMGTATVPLDSRSITLRPEGGVRPARLRLRLFRKDEPIEGVVARVYSREEVPPHRARYAWSRLRPEQRDNLARANVYPTALLADQEVRNLMHHRLVPLAPEGIAGRDYGRREIYILRDIEGGEVREVPPPAGLIVTAGARGVVPLPERGGKIRFEFQTLEGFAPPGPSGTISLHWYGLGLAERSVFHLPWEGRPTSFTQDLRGGRVEVVAPSPMSVRIFLVEPTANAEGGPPGGAEFTPEPTNAWAYFTQEGRSVEFEVLHVDDEPTPFRIDLRRPSPRLLWFEGPKAEIEGLPARVSYEGVDRLGETILRGELATTNLLSEYDRLRIQQQDYSVTDPAQAFLSLPAGVVKLRIRSAGPPVLVAAYNRPWELDKVTLVPEDYYAFERIDNPRRSWFLLRAPDHERRAEEFRLASLVLQARPPADDTDVLAGQYQWEDFRPEGSWRGRNLFVPRDPGLPFRPDALPTTYRELPPNRDLPVRFRGRFGASQVTPGLLVLKDSADPAVIDVFIDGKLHHRITAVGLRVEQLLRPIAAGGAGATHTVRVASSRPVRAFLNFVEPPKVGAFVKRFAIQLGAREISFDVDKSSKAEEVLSLTLYRAPEIRDRTRLRATLEFARPRGHGPHLSWTFPRRLFDIRPAGGPPLPVLETRDESVDQGQSFFLPLAADIPPGRYRLRLAIEGGAGGYLIIAKTTPGLGEERRFSSERPLDLP